MTIRRRGAALLCLLALVIGVLFGCDLPPGAVQTSSLSLEEVPEYTGEPYVVLYDNQPGFDLDDLTTQSFESYSDLDHLGRCGVAFANVGIETMPTEERESISEVKPTGWENNSYEFVDGGYVYNRCHLIGFQLTGENANEQNLITGTRYMNVEGMLPFENLVADYVASTGNHVLYRISPIFDGSNLLASGVEMEAMSVEDEGEGICFHVYVYNVQPGVEIDYATGENWADLSDASQGEIQWYVLNTSSHKFHLPDCSGAENIKSGNRQDYEGTREMLIAQGYAPCGICNP